MALVLRIDFINKNCWENGLVCGNGLENGSENMLVWKLLAMRTGKSSGTLLEKNPAFWMTKTWQTSSNPAYKRFLCKTSLSYRYILHIVIAIPLPLTEEGGLVEYVSTHPCFVDVFPVETMRSPCMEAIEGYDLLPNFDVWKFGPTYYIPLLSFRAVPLCCPTR